jgi:hypothetical protein
MFPLLFVIHLLPRAPTCWKIVVLKSYFFFFFKYA